MQVATKYATKKLLGPVIDKVHKNQTSFETDPEVIAVSQKIAAQQPHHWYSKQVKTTPDIILTQHERTILHKVKKRAWYLDKGFHCCCFNIGLDGIVGLIPGIGDVLTAAMAIQLVKTASKADLPKWLIGKMMWNVMLDFIVGLTPVAGDILDILFKCNWRNALLLEEYLITRRMEEIRSEKGNNAAINDDRTVTIETIGEPSNTTNGGLLHHHPIRSPKPATMANHHYNDGSPHDNNETSQGHHGNNPKYGTFIPK
ncbi:MAG: hypothetical protein EXX96DRAFT_573737 [Benjaminiella poitrasii]|nr:MAG: hypothetical protein EXX96DRAFT_573737 [Benjaminiella poitrasii]